jgi:hypothetical protein
VRIIEFYAVRAHQQKLEKSAQVIDFLRTCTFRQELRKKQAGLRERPGFIA